MPKRTTTIADRQRRMQQLQSPAQPPEGCDLVAASTFERHYSVAELAGLWNLGADAVRRLFEDEPGVLVLGGLRVRRLRCDALRRSNRAGVSRG